MLTVSNLEAGYCDVQVLFGVSLSVKAGEVVTLLGRNGMGKTTTIKSIFGLIRPAAGVVEVEGVALAGQPPFRVAQAGLGLVPEGRQIFPNLDVEENLVATAANRTKREQAWTLERVYAFFPRLKERRRNMGTQLSGGEQQMLAIARALMTEPKLLMLDEPSLGLAPFLVDEIFDIVRKINTESGVAVLLVEQNATAALEIAETGYLIENGRILMNGPAAVLSANPDVAEAYLGGHSRVDYHAVKHYRRRKRWLA